jgi:hypothetical protein
LRAKRALATVLRADKTAVGAADEHARLGEAEASPLAGDEIDCIRATTMDRRSSTRGSPMPTYVTCSDRLEVYINAPEDATPTPTENNISGCITHVKAPQFDTAPSSTLAGSTLSLEGHFAGLGAPRIDAILAPHLDAQAPAGFSWFPRGCTPAGLCAASDKKPGFDNRVWLMRYEVSGGVGDLVAISAKVEGNKDWRRFTSGVGGDGGIYGH